MEGDREQRLEEELDRARTALKAVWIIHVRKEVHLGPERGSGVADHCIPCICAAALHQGMDEVPLEELKRVLAELEGR